MERAFLSIINGYCHKLVTQVRKTIQTNTPNLVQEAATHPNGAGSRTNRYIDGTTVKALGMTNESSKGRFEAEELLIESGGGKIHMDAGTEGGVLMEVES